MPSEDKNILKYNPGEKSLKVANIFYLDTESLLKKTQSCQNNPQESDAERKSIHEACGYSLSLVTSYDPNKNTHSYSRGKDSIKRLCKDIKNQALEVVNFKKEDMIPLTDDENRYYEKRKYCHICKRKFWTDKDNKSKYKICQKVRDHCHYSGKFRGAAQSICNLRYKVQQKIPVVIHDGSTYDYHITIKESPEEFKNDLNCLGENMKKYITFSVPLKKENNNNKIITYRLKFIDSFRFMNTSLSALSDNLSEIL